MGTRDTREGVVKGVEGDEGLGLAVAVERRHERRAAAETGAAAFGAAAVGAAAVGAAAVGGDAAAAFVDGATGVADETAAPDRATGITFSFPGRGRG